MEYRVEGSDKAEGLADFLVRYPAEFEQTVTDTLIESGVNINTDPEPPGLFEILDGTVEVSQIRDVEIEDLLGREAVRLDEDVVRSFIAGQAVTVAIRPERLRRMRKASTRSGGEDV